MTNSGGSTVACNTYIFVTDTSMSQGFDFETLNTVTNFSLTLLRSNITTPGGYGLLLVGSALVQKAFIIYINCSLNMQYLAYFGATALIDTISVTLTSSTLFAGYMLTHCDAVSVTNFAYFITNATITTQWVFYFTGSGAFSNFNLQFINSPLTPSYPLYHGPSSSSVTNMSLVLLNSPFSSSMSISSGYNFFGIMLCGTLSNLLIVFSNFSVPNSILFRSISSVVTRNLTIIASGVTLSAGNLLFQFDTPQSVVGLTMLFNSVKIVCTSLLLIGSLSGFVNNTLISIASSTVSCSDTLRCVYLYPSGVTAVVSNMTISVTDTTMTQGIEFSTWNTIANVSLAFIRMNITGAGGYGLLLATSAVVKYIVATYVNCSLNAQSFAAFNSPLSTDSVAISVTSSTVAGLANVVLINTGSVSNFVFSAVNTRGLTASIGLKLAGSISLTNVQVTFINSPLSFSQGVYLRQMWP